MLKKAKVCNGVQQCVAANKCKDRWCGGHSPEYVIRIGVDDLIFVNGGSCRVGRTVVDKERTTRF